ncbi:YdiY family protein [Aquabacterium sp.]|uniref:DUF481 domain-containing protein n=1 Tax=Aquabacterium sp. TaxID=1872578 RepID=UPI0037841B79
MTLRSILLGGLALAACASALAQATVKPDGQFRAAIGLGASTSSGNSRATNLSLVADAVRATEDDKSTLFANGQYASSSGTTTAERFRLGGRHDHNLGPLMFVFGGLDFERNKFANLQLRSQLQGGLGYHLIKTSDLSWDLFGGLGYTKDSYVDPTRIDDAVRTRYSYATLLLAEESTHKLGSNTSFKQRLAVTPNLKNRWEYRATWDAGLAVAMSSTLNLTVGFSANYNSEPGLGLKSTDTLLTTGVSIKFD